MDCTFNKFRNALGVYRVVIDSVLTSVQSENRTIALDLQIPNLIEYFKVFQYESTDVNEFVALALDSVVNAYNLTLSTLNSSGLVDIKGLNSEQEMSLRNNFQGHLTKMYQLESLGVAPNMEQDLPAPTNDSELESGDGIISKGHIQPAVTSPTPSMERFITGSKNTVQNISIPSTSIVKFSDIAANYYKGAADALSHLERNLTQDLFNIRILQPLKSSSNNAQKILNKEIRDLKNRFFEQLTFGYKFESESGNVLYDQIGNMVQPRFKAILDTVRNEFANMNGGKGITAENLTLWSRMPVDKRQMLHKYNAFVALSNFDLLVEERSGNTIKVRKDLKNIETSSDKYLLASTNKMRTGYTDNAHISALDETTKIYQMFLETVPVIKLNGNVSSNLFLNNKRVNYTLGKLNRDLNLSDPTGSLVDTLTDILKNIDNRGGRNLDNSDLSTLITLYARVYRNKSSDEQIKTSNKNLYRILNNLDHNPEYSQFNLNNTIYNLFSNVHTSGNDINFLDLVSSNILKVDVKNYSEVTYDFSKNTYKQVNLSSKLTDKQKFNLKYGLGGQIVSRTKNVIDDFKRTYDVQVDNKIVTFILNGVNIKYDVEKGIFINASGREITNFGNSNDIRFDDVVSSFISTKDNSEVKDLGNWSGITIPKSNIDSADILQLVDGVPAIYSNYSKLVKNFENMLTQPLSSDNYRLLDLFRTEIDGSNKDTQGNHLKAMLTLMGNYVYLADTNAKTINSNLKLSNKKVIDNLAKVIGNSMANSIWDKNQKHFRIDFNNVGIGALSDYAEVLNNYYQTNIKAVTLNTEGNFVPTSGIMAPINRYADIIKSIKRDTNSVLRNNFLLQNHFKDREPIIRMIDSRTGVKGKDGKIVSPSRLNQTELLKTNILYEFLYNKVNDGSFKVQPTNYADKSVQSLLNINPKAIVKYWDSNANTWSSDVTYDSLNNQQIIDTYYKTMDDYYLNLSSELVSDYSEVVSVLPMTYFENTSFLKNYVEELGLSLDNITIESFPEEYRDADLENELNSYNSLRDLKVRSSRNRNDLTKALNEVNKGFSLVNENALLEAFKISNVTWINNLHFEKTAGKFGINRSLIYLLNKHQGDVSNDIKSIERNFIQTLISDRFTMDYLNSELRSDSLYEDASKLYKNLGKFKNPNLGRYDLYIGDINDNFEINPILKDYLWNNLLISRNFQNLTVGSPLGHPAKLGSDATPEQLLAARLVAQNKRMVIHQATMHPYSMNLINGIGFKTNKLFMSDPLAKVFNLIGQEDQIDAVDGATYQLVSTTLMQNNSLLDQKVGYTHKSISGTISERLGAAGLTKHAAFSLTNENIRNSPLLGRLVSTMLNRQFSKVGDIELVNLDITKDYNNDYIDIEGLLGEVAFIKTGEHSQFDGINADSDGRLVKFKGLRKDGPLYRASYQIGHLGEVFEVPVSINTYNDLWKVLGGSTSIELDNESIGNKPNTEFDGYIDGNSSWAALTEYINRVGFWYNNNDIGNFLEDNSAKNIKKVKENFNTYIHEPNSLNVDRTKNSSRISQKNIIQPLKINYLGEITFFSGQKVGMKNGMTLDKVLSANSEFDILTSLESNMHNGIQLNADHEVDQSEVTEQTQIINTLSFTGETPEYPEKAFRAIAKYINQKLGDIIASTKTTSEQGKDEVYDLVKRIVVKAFKDKDVDTLANSIVQNIKRELETGLVSNFQLPISSSELYNIVNTAISNFFTKEGIRRKMAGMAAVAKPYSQFIKFKKLPDGRTVSHTAFEKWLAQNPDYPETSLIRHHDFDIYDTIIDPDGKRIEILDASTYIRTKLRMDREGGEWRKDNFADRDLGSTYHRFKISGVGNFTYYDLPIVALPNFLNDVRDAHKKYKDILSKGVEVSPIRQAQIGDLNSRILSAKINLETRVSEYNEILNLANGTTENLNLSPIILDGDNVSYSEFSTAESNRVKNLIKNTLTEIQETNTIPIPYTIRTQYQNNSFNLDFVDGNRIAIDEIETVYGEIVMGFPHRTTFGIDKDMDVSDVTVNYFEDQLNRYTLPSTTKHDMYLKHSSGNHLYVLFTGSENHTDLITSGVLEPVKLDVKHRDDLIFELDEYGNEKYQIGFDTLYRGNVDGKVTEYVILDGINDAVRLSVMFNQKTSKYDDLVFNYQSGIENLPKAIQLSELGLLKANNNILKSLYQTLHTDSDISEELPYLTELIRADRYNEDWADRQLNIVSKKLDSLNRADNARLYDALTRKLELLNAYKMYDEDISENRDLILSILELDVNHWVSRHLKRTHEVGKSIEDYVNDQLEELQNTEYERVRNSNSEKAIAKYASFLESLNVTIARIPGQDFQHYSSMKVVNFISNETNTIYVPPRFQWTSGGDFDIDKVFSTFFSIGRDGLISGWTTLWDNSDSEFLKASLKLPLPESIIFENIVENQSDGLNLEEVVSIINYLNNNTYDLEQFNHIVNALNKINKAREIRVQGSNIPVEVINSLIEFSNWYMNESDEVSDKNGAALNAIFTAVKDSIADIRNITDSYSPSTFGEYQEQAKYSSKGAEMTKMSYENPVDIFRAQVGNMVGKEVIGVVASSGLKSYSVLAQAFTRILRGEMGPNMKEYEVPIMKNGKLSFKKGTGVYGVNYTRNIPAYKEYLRQAFGLREIEIDNIVSDLINRGSVSLDLSAILSAATDNAKELILSRINAGPDTVGYYLAAAMLGIDVETISKIMISETTDAIINLSSRDVFIGREITFDSALEQIKNRILDSKNYYDFKLAANTVLNLETKMIGDKSVKQIVEEEWIHLNNVKPINGKKPFTPEIRTNPFTFLNLLNRAIYRLNIPKQYIDSLSKNLKGVVVREITAKDSFTTRDINNIRIRQNPEDVINEELAAEYSDAYLDSMDIGAYERSYEEETDVLDDFYGDEYYEGDEFNTRSYSPPLTPLDVLFNRYLNDYSDLIDSVNIDDNIIKGLEVVGRFKNDIELLGRLTSVNQKVKNTHYDLRKFVNTLRNYVADNYIPREDRLDVGKAMEIESRVDGIINSVLQGTYSYNYPFTTSGGRSLIDLLDVIQSSPHMRAMLEAAFSAYNSYRMISIKTRTVDKVLDDIGIKLANQENYIKISSFIDDAIIASALNSLPSEYTTFIANTNDIVRIGEEPITSNYSFDVKTVEGRVNFVDWFENTVIRDLKDGYVVERDSRTGLIEVIYDGSISSNEFIKRLTIDMKRDLTTDTPYTYYKIPINMLDLDNINNVEMVSELKTYFHTLKGKSYNGKSIIDMFFLYDLIVNKSKVNANSLSPLLDSVIDLNDNSLMTIYKRTVGEMDFDAFSVLPDNIESETNGYSLNDLASRHIGTILYQLPILGTDVSRNEKIVTLRKWDSDDKVVKNESYYLQLVNGAWNYVLANPQASSKYVNVSVGDVNRGKTYKSVKAGIELDILNRLILNANIISTDC